MLLTEKILANAPLGKKSSYENHYNPSLLFALARLPKREEIGLSEKLPFTGTDIWTAYELSWLNKKSKPLVAIADIFIPAASPNIIESKSFKLYLNSFNNTAFHSPHEVQETIAQDLSKALQDQATIHIHSLENYPGQLTLLDGLCLDDLDIACSTFEPDTTTLTTVATPVRESVYTNLLKSNCLVTGQPDWGSVQISYAGNQINHAGLLQYIVSLRDHNEFHEQCIERIFMDIKRLCKPSELTVYARYTRRGGLDINPFRTDCNSLWPTPLNRRLVRQ
jgi:7-cyano-7-deazaguanine reductase